MHTPTNNTDTNDFNCADSFVNFRTESMLSLSNEKLETGTQAWTANRSASSARTYLCYKRFLHFFMLLFVVFRPCIYIVYTHHHKIWNQNAFFSTPCIRYHSGNKRPKQHPNKITCLDRGSNICSITYQVPLKRFKQKSIWKIYSHLSQLLLAVINYWIFERGRGWGPRFFFHSKSDIGGSRTPQHRKKSMVNTATPHKNSTKHRHHIFSWVTWKETFLLDQIL